VDPIDGTQPFVKRACRAWCVSIAFMIGDGAEVRAWSMAPVARRAVRRRHRLSGHVGTASRYRASCRPPPITDGLIGVGLLDAASRRKLFLPMFERFLRGRRHVPPRRPPARLALCYVAAGAPASATSSTTSTPGIASARFAVYPRRRIENQRLPGERRPACRATG